MGAVFGASAALFIGMAELFGRRVVAQASVVTASAVLSLFGTVVTVVAALFIGGSWVTSDMVFGVVSGLGMAAGLGFYFVGLDHSSSTVVAPTSATVTAVLPYLYALLRGEDASGLAIVGAAIAFAGLTAIATGTLEMGKLRQGLLWGGLSGVGYGSSLAMFVEVSEASGAWAAVAQRAASLAVFVVVAIVVGAKILPPSGTRRDAVASGSFGGMTSVLLVFGLRADAPAAIVTSSMFPLVSVVVGFFVFHDEVRRRQVVGVALALLGIGLVVST